MDLRAIIRARAIAQHGAEKGAIAALAKRLAPRWGKLPDRVAERLSRFLNGHDAMGADALVDVLDELGATGIEWGTANGATQGAK